MINKQTLILASIILIALFLRLYRLSEIMPFIPDIGWFYVSARDMIINQQIPLVGIASSHSWVHQGPLWTYFLGIPLALFNFNPVAPAYFTALLDVLTLVFVYFFAKITFGERIAIFSSIFYATSPLIVFSAQTPYHTSPIPFFTTLLLISVYKWVKGNILFFPVAIFLLAVLYNLELATFSLVVTVSFIFFLGFIKKKDWAMRVIKKKTIALSILGFTIPMIPMLLYDLNHGFPQTLKFTVWVFYRVAVFLGYPPINPNVPGETWSSFFRFILDYIGRFYFIRNEYLALVLLILILVFVMYKLYASRLKDFNLGIVLFFFLFPGITYIAAKTNSAAYLPMFFPQAAILFGYLFGSFKKRYLSVSVIILIIIIGFNLDKFYARYYFDMSFTKRVEIAKEIIKKSNNRSYNITDDMFRIMDKNAAKNYEYLTWWLGNPPSAESQKLKYYINENSSKITVEGRVRE